MMLWKAAPTALALSLLFTLGVTTAAAQEGGSRIELHIEGEASVGKEMTIKAYLLDSAGDPIRRETVRLFLQAEFMNAAGSVEVAKARTDERGLALMVYIPRREGEQKLTARFGGNPVFAAAEESTSLPVGPGGATYQEEEPFRMPLANIRAVVLVLSIVWGLYLVVLGRFWLISRAEKDEYSRARGRG